MPKAKRRVGRPTKCNARRTKIAAETLELGATWAMVAAAIGVSPSNVRNWLAKGRRGEGAPYVKFLARCSIASAKGGIQCLRELHLKGFYLPSAWKLERRFGYTRDGKLARAQLAWTDSVDTDTDVDTAPTAGQARKVVEALKLGATFEMAAGHAGVGPEELRGWFAKGRGGDKTCAALLRRAVTATAECGIEALQNMGKGKGWFLPNAWLLERRFAYTQGGELAVSQMAWAKTADGSAAVEAEAARLVLLIDRGQPDEEAA